MTACTVESGATASAATWSTQATTATAMPTANHLEANSERALCSGRRASTSGALEAPRCLHRKPSCVTAAHASASPMPSGKVQTPSVKNIPRGRSPSPARLSRSPWRCGPGPFQSPRRRMPSACRGGIVRPPTLPAPPLVFSTTAGALIVRREGDRRGGADGARRTVGAHGGEAGEGGGRGELPRAGAAVGGGGAGHRGVVRRPALGVAVRDLRRVPARQRARGPPRRAGGGRVAQAGAGPVRRDADGRAGGRPRGEVAGLRDGRRGGRVAGGEVAGLRRRGRVGGGAP